MRPLPCTATQSLPFTAGPIGATDTVQWTAQLNYATSGNKAAFQNNRSFTTNAGQPTHNETYASMGGKISVRAANSAGKTDQVTFYVVGTSLDDATITNRLISLYTGTRLRT